jgi:simple sugar transport system ATP-binding protein
MSDIRRLADRIICLRDGAISGRFEGQPLDYEGAVNAMLGHGLINTGIDIHAPGASVLDVRGVRLLPDSRPFDLSLHKGEVVALTGLIGMGKTAFAETLVGGRRAAAGTLALGGQPYAPRNIREAIAAGVFLSAKDRANNAVVPMFSIFQTISLPFLERYQSMGLLFGGPERAMAREQIQNLGIVCQTEWDLITTLSGGNQQKSVVARWLSQLSRLLILDEPFQGVDIQARRDIGFKLRKTANDRATLVLCAELDEALEVADRILVMSGHTIVGEHLNRDVDLDLILAQIAGHSSQIAA